MCNAGFVRKLREVQRQAVLDCHLIRTRRRRAADFRRVFCRVFCRSQAGSGALLAPLDVEAHVAHARLEDLLRRRARLAVLQQHQRVRGARAAHPSTRGR